MPMRRNESRRDLSVNPNQPPDEYIPDQPPDEDIPDTSVFKKREPYRSPVSSSPSTMTFSFSVFGTFPQNAILILAEKAKQKAKQKAEQKAAQIAEQKAAQIAEQKAEQKAAQIAEQKAAQIAEQKAAQIAEQKAAQIAVEQRAVEQKADEQKADVYAIDINLQYACGYVPFGDVLVRDEFV